MNTVKASTSKSLKIPPNPGAGRVLTSRPTGPGTALANFLIDLLPTLGRSNDELASAMGYKRPNVISMWKSARTKVTLDAIWKIQEVTNVPLPYLLALYFEQYAGETGVDHFQEIVNVMSRTTTAAEWEIIEIVRKARKHNDLALKPDQRAALKKLFTRPELSEGPLAQIEFKFATAGDRRRFARRGHDRDMSVSEIEEQAARKAPGGATGKVLKTGSRVKETV